MARDGVFFKRMAHVHPRWRTPALSLIGQGANDAVRKQIESLGTNLLVVVPGATTMGGMRSGPTGQSGVQAS